MINNVIFTFGGKYEQARPKMMIFHLFKSGRKNNRHLEATYE